MPQPHRDLSKARVAWLWCLTDGLLVVYAWEALTWQECGLGVHPEQTVQVNVHSALHGGLHRAQVHTVHTPAQIPLPTEDSSVSRPQPRPSPPLCYTMRGWDRPCYPANVKDGLCYKSEHGCQPCWAGCVEKIVRSVTCLLDACPAGRCWAPLRDEH